MRSSPPAAACAEAELRAIENALQFDDPINIQYTSGHDRLSEGGDALAPQHPEQRLSSLGEQLALHGARPRVRAGAVLPLLRHGARQSRLHLPRGLHRRAGRGFDPLAVLETVQAERCTSLYGVPTMFIAELGHPRFAEFDLSSACAPGSWPVRRARSK